jgi:hypothetical protein
MPEASPTQRLNLALQSLKDSVEALKGIADLDNLPTLELTPSQAKAVEKHAEKVVSAEVAVAQTLEAVMRENDIPVQRASSALLKYYRQIYLPYREIIWRLQDPIFAELADALPPAEPRETYFCNVSETLKDAIEHLENELVLNPYLQDPDQLEFDITETWRLTSSVFFRPNEWLSHIDELTPIMCAKDASSIPTHVRARLREVYRT